MLPRTRTSDLSTLRAVYRADRERAEVEVLCDTAHVFDVGSATIEYISMGGGIVDRYVHWGRTLCAHQQARR